MVTIWFRTGILVVHIPWDIMSKDVYPYDSLNINILEYNEFYGHIYIYMYAWQLSTCAAIMVIVMKVKFGSWTPKR